MTMTMTNGTQSPNTNATTDKSQFIVHHYNAPNLDFRYECGDDKSAQGDCLQSPTNPHGTVIQVNDHEISNEDATWQAFNGSCDDQQQPATLWTRINRIVKDALGYSSNSAMHSTGVAISDPFNA